MDLLYFLATLLLDLFLVCFVLALLWEAALALGRLCRRLLPAGELSEILTDLVFYYLGHRFEFDVELGLDARLATPVRLGVSGELGWTSWMAPKQPKDGETIVLRDARFDPMERRRETAGKKPKAAASAKTGASR